MVQAEYQRRLEARQATVAATTAELARLGGFRLLAFGLAIGIFIAASGGWITAHLLWLPVAAFTWLVIAYGRVSQRKNDAERAVLLYERALARLGDAWAGEGHVERLAPDHHVYADDLDLFGKGSLFDLACRARTRAGARRLADWWLAPATRDVVLERQAAVLDLKARLDLREDLALIGGEVSSALDRGSAAAWGEAPQALRWPWFPHVARVLGLVSTVTVVGWLGFGWSLLVPVVAIFVQILVCRPVATEVGEVLEASGRPATDLLLVGRLLERIQTESFEAPLLQRLRAAWTEGEHGATTQIRRLGRLASFVEARENQFFAPFSALLCLGTQLAYAVERWRAEHGEHVAGWVGALGDFEALLSLASYAYERPDHTMPEIAEEALVLEAEAIGHPLLPDARCVRNDVRLARDDAGPHALLISGSNMSGKSTLLRSIGINTVLALSGGPVRAARMRVGPMYVGASIRVMDSLQEGASRFYAEIERLKQVLDLTEGGRPALFLLDEILHGTNSHDRRIGAEAVVRELLVRGAIGCVTTHDLALAKIAAGEPGMQNVHFADEVVDGRMEFDYRMREGIVQRSNALALMRAVGLPLAEGSGSDANAPEDGAPA
ncbi:MAG: DNA mismatch repair protein MutS [Planctomycetota bacterium]|nr:DNA mismatch repair protein MutS [Planctomycetota bacterium]